MSTRTVTALKLTLRLIRYTGIDMFQYSNEEVPPVSVKQGHARGSLFLTMQIHRVSFTKLTFTQICDTANKMPTEMNTLVKVFENFRINSQHHVHCSHSKVQAQAFVLWIRKHRR